MDFHFVFCVVLCAVSSASCAGLRYPRQSWQNPDDPHGFHFPDMTFQADNNDRFNEVVGFPGNFPPGFPDQGNNQFGVRPNANEPWGRPDGNQGWPNFNQQTTSRPNNNQNWGNNQGRPNNNQNWEDNQGWPNFNQQTTSRPNNNQNWGNNQGRPDNNQNSGDNQRRPSANGATTQRTTMTTSAAGSSTPRTYHLAPEGCDCPSTPQFNPVCGSDGNTYKNSGLLKCFRLCGVDVSQKRMGAC